MENPIVRILLTFSPLTASAIADFEQIIGNGRVKKNTELLSIGQKSFRMYFISKGLARAYYLYDDREITDYFAMDGQFIGAVPGAITKQISHKAIHLIEESDVYWFDLEAFDQCCAKHHCLETATRRLISFALIEEQLRIESLRCYPAKERYFELERKYPGLSNRSPLKYIASYLNTSQVSISRIRAGLQ
jgi:CRP-like cAMP-binding protein